MKRALVVVDFQVDFVDGALGFEGARDLDEKIANRIEEYRNSGDDVIFTYDTHGKDYLNTREGNDIPTPHCIKGEEGWNLFGQVREKVRKEDKAILKGSFGSLDLGEYLKENAFEEVELCGLVSSICVISNAIIAKAALPEAEILVDRELTDSYDKSMQERAFDIMKNLGITIIEKQ